MKIYDGTIVQFTNTTGATIPENSVVNLGTVTNPLIGVTLAPVENQQIGAIQLYGVFRLSKTSGQTYSVGDLLYWDATNKRITNSSTGNARIGRAFKAAAGTDTTVDVLVNAV